MENRISELPEDILIHIISSLTMKEAGKTSVLSKRWKHVWTYTTTLKFDSHNVIYDMLNKEKEIKIEEPKYLNWVERVITLHKAAIIDEFRVQFELLSVDNSKYNIDKWIRFAMDKNVKKLEVDFAMYYGHYGRKPHFSFPKWFSSNSLISLELGLIDVTGKILEGLLCTCLALEILSVKYSFTLSELNVIGPNLKLKSLVIHKCLFIQKLVISAPNLVFLCYTGPELNMHLKSTPKLTQLSIGGRYVDSMIDWFRNFSSQYSQLEELTISPLLNMKEIRISIEDFVVIPRLRKLDVSIDAYEDDNICFIASWMKACPLLHHFVLKEIKISIEDFLFPRLRKLDVSVDVYGDDNICVIASLMKLSVRSNRMGRKTHIEPIPCPHYHLKTVEIIGCIKPIHMDIASFLIENAFVLEKITVDPRPIYLTGRVPMDEEEKMEATKGAEKIRAHLKDQTKLDILPAW